MKISDTLSGSYERAAPWLLQALLIGLRPLSHAQGILLYTQRFGFRSLNKATL